jgi:hypothetical protein
MPTGYHRVCAVASPGGDEAVEMASDCHLVRGAGNSACIDGAESTNDDTSGGRESHLTNPIRCRHQTTNPQRMSPGPMNCPKTATQPLALPGVVAESGEARSRGKDISSGIEQTVKCLAHLEMLAHVLSKGTKSDTRKVIDREPRFVRVIQREHTSTQCLDLGVRKTFIESR